MGITKKGLDTDASVSFGLKDLGVLFATFDGKDLPWGPMEKADVKLRYNNQDVGAVTLTEGMASKDFVKPIGETVDKPLEYKVTFKLEGTDAAPITYPADNSYALFHNVRADLKTYEPTLYLAQLLPYKQGEVKTYTFALAEGVEKAQIKMFNLVPLATNPKTYLKFNKTITLRRPKEASAEWKILKAEGATINVTGATAVDAKNKKYQTKTKELSVDQDSYTVGLEEITSEF
jgi:hypothetical protein